jgi:hypothetical protein
VRIGALGRSAVNSVPIGTAANDLPWGSFTAPWWETLIVMIVIALMLVGCVAIVKHVRRRNLEPKPVADQWEAFVAMEELCPDGWQAQITVYGRDAPIPEDAPAARDPLIELEWKQFEGEQRRVTVARRAWARTIGGALQMMVDARRTDAALERGEHAGAQTSDVWEAF